VRLQEILTLSEHGADVWVGTGPTYPWGGLYGGQIVAQGLLAAGRSVDEAFSAHSVRAYFIRRGEHAEPVRYEIDRIRDGRTFCTRRVVARQNGAAILNLEASFQRHEPSADIETVSLDRSLPTPGELRVDSWSPAFERAFIPDVAAGFGGGRAAAWLRSESRLPEDPLVQAAGLAFLSDDLPTDAVVRSHPVAAESEQVRHAVLFSASLDHTIWFHRPGRADEWHLHDFSCHSFVGGRGLALGHLHSASGDHVATVAQEVLLRDNRELSG
jgi:acyl-CoA thioesterase-2